MIVARGVDLVDRTLNSFKNANEKSAQTSTLVTEITSASQEQLQGLKQLSEVATEMDRTTQGTAASAQETAFASETVQEQAARLKHTVNDLARFIHGFSRTTDSPETSTATGESRQTSTTPAINNNQEAGRRLLLESDEEGYR